MEAGDRRRSKRFVIPIGLAECHGLRFFGMLHITTVRKSGEQGVIKTRRQSCNKRSRDRGRQRPRAAFPLVSCRLRQGGRA